MASSVGLLVASPPASFNLCSPSSRLIQSGDGSRGRVPAASCPQLTSSCVRSMASGSTQASGCGGALRSGIPTIRTNSQANVFNKPGSWSSRTTPACQAALSSGQSAFFAGRLLKLSPSRAASPSQTIADSRPSLRQVSLCQWCPSPSAFPLSRGVGFRPTRPSLATCPLGGPPQQCQLAARHLVPPLAAAREANEPHAASMAPPIQEDPLFLQTGLTQGGMDSPALEELLSMKLPSHPQLHRGILQNGLRYVILPNKVPPNRFEAHLEMHVGSVDEEEHEQGVAHMIEHVTFLGSKRREKLLGTGARSNAYTDFHHTVFHVHSPVTAQGSEELLLPMVLEALHEIAFCPKFLPLRIEKERRAVLSELQMMNTIEYRVDCQLLQQLHSENLLSQRFPIGLEEQIATWDLETIRKFHEKWYFPANATLFVVGDIGSVSRTVDAIHAQFDSTPPGVHNPPPPPEPILPPTPPRQSTPSLPFSLSNPFSFGKGPSIITPFLSSPQPPREESVLASKVPHSPPPIRKERHPIRPPVEHRWSSQNLKYAKSGYAAPLGLLVNAHIFQHELLQNFSISLFCKTPVRPVVTFGDLRNVLMQRIVLSTLQFRINTRYKSANPPFLGVDLDHSDSGREGCTVSTLTVTAEPRHWQGALKVGCQEVRRLREFGVTRGELARYLGALLKDSEQLAAMIDSIPSVDNLDFIMESDALGHTVMDQQQGHLCLSDIAPTVTLADVNEVAASVLEYVADFGQPSAPVPAGIVACVPSKVHDADGGEELFEISQESIRNVILEGLREPLAPEPEVEVPESLISAAELAELKRKNQPAFVAVDQKGGPSRVYDEATGVIQRRLSNGIKINMKVTQNEAKGGVLRILSPGGRARETPKAPGAVAIGVRTLSEGGTVGSFSREQVELFCVSKLINCVLEADEEFVCMDFHFTLRDGGLPATLQLLHSVLQKSAWVEDALQRAKQLYLSHFRAMPKSLERATAHRLMKAMFDADPRLIEPSPDAIARLDLATVRAAVMRQLLHGSLELNMVGDFEEEEAEQILLDFLGTIDIPTAAAEAGLLPGGTEVVVEDKPVRVVEVADQSTQHQKVMLRDTDERACAYIAGAAPNRWGFTADGRDLGTILDPVPPSLSEAEAQALAPPYVSVVSLDPSSLPANRVAPTNGNASSAAAANGSAAEKGAAAAANEKALFWRRRKHPLYAAVAMNLLAEIINARLFTTVRDALGLTYDVSFELSLFDRLRTGWFVISVTSTPGKIDQAVNASLNVLRGLHGNRINQRELDRAKRTLLMRHESDLKNNQYWLGLLTHLQSEAVPRKDVSCIRDLPYLYEVATADDVYNAYNHLSLDEDSVYTCVGVAGAAVLPGAADVVEEIADVDSAAEEEIGGVLAGPQMHGRGMSTMTRPTVLE